MFLVIMVNGFECVHVEFILYLFDYFCARLIKSNDCTSTFLKITVESVSIVFSSAFFILVKRSC